MQLSQYLPSSHIIVDLKGETKFQIIEELMDRLKGNGELVDADIALQDVLARESYLSTGLENGLAIPHAKTDGVDGLKIAFGIKKEGVDFESLDGKPANLIFLVVSPRNTSGPHIQTLAVISRNLKDSQAREALLNVSSAENAAQIIKEQFNA